MKMNRIVKGAIVEARKKQGLPVVGVTDHALAAWGKTNHRLLPSGVADVLIADWADYVQKHRSV